MTSFVSIALALALSTPAGAQRIRPAASASATAAVAPGWTQQSTASSPPARDLGAMAYNAANGTIVLFGGNSGGNILSDTWVYNGTTWTQQSPATSPSGRYGAAMTYDATNGNVVLFGGDNGFGPVSDTWTWNGTNWTQKSPASSPPARTYTMMAYDTKTANVVLFGGSNHVNVFSDTWTWSGTNWTQKSPSSVPPARESHALAYDTATSAIVLFGGDNASSANPNSTTVYSDTWNWDGANWAQQAPTNSPSARIGASMAYMPIAGNLVLYGGLAGNGGSTYYSDTWVWNGVNWTLEPMLAPPSARENASMAYDAATTSVVLFGGFGVDSFSSETWKYRIGGFPAPSSLVGTAATPQTPVNFTVTSSGTLPALSSIKVLTQGATGLDFTLGTGSTCTGTVTVGQACTVYAAFTPAATGQRLGAVNLTDSSGNILATAHVSGVGYGPQITFTPGTISTFAGNGTAGYVASQDGGPAASAELNNPSGVAFDAAGNLYIGDNTNHRIRKVTPAGIITTVAGTGTAGYSASQDGGLATSAQLNYPYGVAVDGAGNLYIADSSNNRIRKVAAVTGLITTVVGNGTQCPDRTTACGDGGAATSANLFAPYSLAFDGAGNLYLADTDDHRIREVNAVTGIITTVAGNGNVGYVASQDGGPATSAELNTPTGIALDSAGNLYIAETNGERVRKVTAATGIITTVAGNGNQGYASSQDGGPATSASLTLPSGVAVDAAGDLYIADFLNERIRQVAASTSIISTIAGNGTQGYVASQDGGAATAAQLNLPFAMALDNAGNLYIADSGNNRIRKISASAAPLLFPNTAISSTSASQTITVNNIGNAPLTLPTPGTGQNPSLSNYFTIANSSTCPLVSSSSSAGMLAVGSTCSEKLSYAPTVSGAVTGNLIFTDNSLNVTGSTQTVVTTGSTLPTLSIQVINQNVPSGTASITLEFTVGYGGNATPAGTPTLKVNNSSTNVGAVTCTGKTGHLNCTATYNPSALAVGTYPIAATVPGDGTYATTTVSGTLTITGTTGGHVASPIRISSPLPTTSLASSRAALTR